MAIIKNADHGKPNIMKSNQVCRINWKQNDNINENRITENANMFAKYVKSLAL